VRYVLESVEIRGNHRTRSRVVLRYVPFSPGDVIDVHDPAVVLSRYRLLGTGFFRDVQFSLRKGSQRGHVILVIDVRERNTLVVTNLWMGLGADAEPDEDPRELTAYGGLGVAETNLAGTGITLGSALGIALNQLAFRLRFYDPVLAGTSLKVDSELLYNDAEDYFGNSNVRHFALAAEEEGVRPFAVVDYERFGGSVGVGHDVSIPAQLWFHYRLESIDASVPLAADHDRGGAQGREPIDFDIDPGSSVLSALRASLRFDTRDQPFLPRRGVLFELRGEVGLGVLGSDYEYQRLDLRASHYSRLPWKHVLELRGIAGAITGYAPFFEQYYINDFSELLAPRALGLNFDRRPSPNFLGTAIEEVRRGHYAAELAGEYRIPVYVGRRSVYGIDFFSRVGVFVLASRRDIEDPPRGWSGAARLPADLTFNLGFKMDTSAGGFSFAFSNVLGFAPVH
jgi:outer membrane protein assembly factor BamA